MNTPRRIFKHYIVPFFMVALGAVVAAFALEEFLVPFQIFDGGIVGVSMIFSKFMPIQLGVLTAVLNTPFLIIGYKRLGKLFLIKSIFAMIIFSIMLGVFEDMEPITDKDILVVAFGGVILGLGVGLILLNGGCLDGTETVALIISRKTDFSVGQIVLGFNILIYAAAGILFGLDRALYSLLTYFITSKVIDIVEHGLEQAKSVMIITDHAEEIADAIHTQLGRTCTAMEGKGRISSSKKTILYCVITRIEVSTIRKIIHDTDGSAFVAISDVSEIVGNHIKKKKEVRPKKEPAAVSATGPVKGSAKVPAKGNVRVPVREAQTNPASHQEHHNS